jgi:hypothetical protein
MKPFLTILASILTGCGGHFINRRWDRVMFFFLLLVLWLVGAWWFQVWDVTQGDRDGGMSIGGRFVSHTDGMLAGVGVIWLWSVVVTAVDALRDREELRARWTLSGGIGALGLSLFSVALFAYYGWYAWGVYLSGSGGWADERVSVIPQGGGDSFSEWIYFGYGFDDDRGQLPEPPAGDGYLTGRFLYHDAPAEGVKLTVVLNGEYETAPLTTNAEGRFQLRLPPGEWYVSLIKTERWSHKPAGSDAFLVLTGDEPRLSAGSYSRHAFRHDKRGKAVMATAEPSPEALTLVIRDHVRMTWPASDDVPVVADAATSVIEWQGYPDATQYLVELSRVERREMGASYYPVASRQVSGATSLALSTFKIEPGDKEVQEYQVEIYAFDADGRLLSESRSYGTEASFELGAGLQIVDESSLDFAGDVQSLSAEKVQALRKNQDRLDAAALLIDEGLLDSADTLLQRVQGETAPGRLEAVQGYLAAQRGDCALASEWFDKARGGAGQGCVPERYRRGCVE